MTKTKEDLQLLREAFRQLRERARALEVKLNQARDKSFVKRMYEDKSELVPALEVLEVFADAQHYYRPRSMFPTADEQAQDPEALVLCWEIPQMVLMESFTRQRHSGYHLTTLACPWRLGNDNSRLRKAPLVPNPVIPPPKPPRRYLTYANRMGLVGVIIEGNL